ncbi:hypothetical protein PI125_g1594 [Phytophthora idaei]|nr:hypothetical protein PI125_g1594 [Phytophthora idaei]
MDVLSGLYRYGACYFSARDFPMVGKRLLDKAIGVLMMSLILDMSGGLRIAPCTLKRFPNMHISIEMGLLPTAVNLFDKGNTMMMIHLPAPDAQQCRQ